MTKTITLSEILTDEEIKLALTLSSAMEIAQQVIMPNLERINAALGQENDPLYLAYMVEYARSKVQAIN